MEEEKKGKGGAPAHRLLTCKVYSTSASVAHGCPAATPPKI